jgi:hypothetical protein
MRVFTQLELKHMTRRHLGELLRQIMNELPDLPEDSVERDNALTNLRNITRVLAGRELTLGERKAKPRTHRVRGFPAGCGSSHWTSQSHPQLT